MTGSLKTINVLIVSVAAVLVALSIAIGLTIVAQTNAREERKAAVACVQAGRNWISHECIGGQR